MSACMAARLSIVSSSDSPLLVDEAAMFRLMTSADRRLEAISKVVRVRVEFSKNRLNTLFPRISGTFLTSRSEMLTKLEAVSRMWLTMDLGRPSMVSRCCSSPFLFSCGLCIVVFDRERKVAVAVAGQRQRLARRERGVGAGEIGRHRQFAAVARGQRGQHDALRAAV